MNNLDLSNAAAIAKNAILGVSHLVALKIVIEGKRIFYHKSFTLEQSTKNHHQFRLVLSFDALGTAESYQMDEAQKLLGKRLLILFQYKNITEKPESEFHGVITGVSFEQEHGSLGNIVLTGYSPTILLDGAPHIQSFGGSQPIGLADLATKIMQQGLDANKYQTHIEVEKKINMSYICQYNETHYNFLARVAAMYGQQFFYDGKQLCFGKIPHSGEPIQLIYGRDVSNINVIMQVQHVNRNLYGYNSLDNERLTPSYGTHLQHVGGLAKEAYKTSENTYLTPSLQIAPIKASTHMDIDDSQKGIIGNQGTQVFVTTGTTSVPFLHPGCLVKLHMTKPGQKNSNYFTEIIITDIKHEVDALGYYKGHFEAVAAHTGYLPQIAFKTPLAEPQMAQVINNSDSKGRVQVRFDWQQGNEQTEFIRVLTPDAGSSDKVSKNRGLVFIPEVGDQVMVGFVHSHPDRPYVMGGLFHGKIASGGGSQNHLKTIITRSGCTIQLDDTDNQGSVTIKDPSGNTWYMDGAGNINVTAPKNFTINAGENVSITAGMNITTSAGQNISETAGANHASFAGAMMMQNAVTDYSLIAANISEIAEGERKSKAKTIKENAEAKDVAVEGNNNWHTQKEFNNNSSEKSNSY